MTEQKYIELKARAMAKAEDGITYKIFGHGMAYLVQLLLEILYEVYSAAGSSGSTDWASITGKPTIPSATSQLSNDSAFVTATQQTTAVSAAVTALVDNAPTDGNTLGKVNNKVVAINAIIGGSTADGDTLVNTVSELLTVFSAYTEAVDIVALFASKAPLASPTFSGNPSLPTGTTGVTQSAADNSSKLATTAFVKTQAYAPLASPAFSGTPTLPTGTTGVTQTASDNSTKLATTAFVKSQGYITSGLTTGGYITNFSTDVITAGPGGGGTIVLGYDSLGIAIVNNAIENVGFLSADNLTGDRMLQLPDSNGTLLTSGINALPTAADNAAAVGNGLLSGQIYQTATGEIRIVI